jgi:hypothetical protein
MPHHFYQEAEEPHIISERHVEYWEVRITRLYGENGKPVEGSTVICHLPVKLLFAHEALTDKDDAEQVQGVLLRELEKIALKKDTGKAH